MTKYTYRNGKKIELEVDESSFVVRGQPDELRDRGFEVEGKISSGSTRIRTTDLTRDMSATSREFVTLPTYRRTDTKAEFNVTDRIVIVFKSAPSDDEINTIIAKHALIIHKKIMPTVIVFRVTPQTLGDVVDVVVKLTEENRINVASADHDLNHNVRKYNLPRPSDPAFQRQWHLETDGSLADVDARSSANCLQAWRSLGSLGDPDVVVAVTDDGCQLSHRDFGSSGKFAHWAFMSGDDLIHRDSIGVDASEMYQSGANHGTSCAGVIAADTNAALTVGAAPGCRLLPVKWESSATSLHISDTKFLTVLQFLADKVDVISNSWGSAPIDEWLHVVVNFIDDLKQNGGRRGKGVVVTWAAGNENCPINLETNLDIPFTDGVRVLGDQAYWIGVQTSNSFRNNLVDVPNVLFVAALASTARRSHYSNYGPGIRITAPSSNSHTYHRMNVVGRGITTTTGEQVEVTDRFGGTSSATPLVAGVAALIISANKNLNALEVIDILLSTASKDLDTTPYPRTEPAPFDQDTSWDISPAPPFNSGAFDSNGWSPWFGHGRVDAAAAVDSAIAGLTS